MENPRENASVHSKKDTLLVASLVLISGVAFGVFFVTPPEFWMAFPSLFRILYEGDWLGRFPAVAFWLTLLCCFLAYCLYLLVGFPLVRTLRLSCSKPVFACLAFVFGWGLVSQLLEIAAIFHLLKRHIVLLAFGLAFLCALAVAKKRAFRLEALRGACSRASDSRDWLWWSACAIIAVITFLTFYHALLYPVTYWDSLILYTHYGEMTYREQGFPTRVCAQVGLGLGANYPHYYPLTSATMATLWGEWSDLYAQGFPPLVGLISTILLYDLLLGFYASRRIAILGSLLFRSLAYSTCYFIWATDYALVMMLATVVLWFCQRISEAASELSSNDSAGGDSLLYKYTLCAVASVAFGMHINYLGVILVVPLCAALLVIPSIRVPRRLCRFGCLIVCGLMLLGGSWYLRNWLVTGNPVYAFFPGILGGKYIDLDVLASCSQEWTSNGDGVVRFGDTLLKRVVRSPEFFFLHTNWHWKFGPILFGLSIPGALLAVFLRTRRERVFFAAVGSLLAGGIFFQYFVSGLYLYHILFIAPCLACLATLVVRKMLSCRWAAGFASALVLAIGLVPGISMALVGPKLMSFDLRAFRCPGIERDIFWTMCFMRDAEMWRFINERLPENAGVLTHENRYHVFRRDIRIVHADDWDFSRLYGKEFSEVLSHMNEKSIEYYYFVPNERNHPILAHLGIHENLVEHFEELCRSGDRVIYRIRSKN